MDISDIHTPPAGPAVEKFETIDALIARVGGKASALVTDALLLGTTAGGYIFIAEDAKIKGRVKLPYDLQFVADVQNNENGNGLTNDGNGNTRDGELEAAICGSFDPNPEGKVYHLAALSTKANYVVRVVFCFSGRKPTPRSAILERDEAENCIWLSVVG